MLETIGNIALIIVMIILICLIVNGLKNEDNGGGCNMDCKNCPFPPCTEEDKARMKNGIYNG